MQKLTSITDPSDDTLKWPGANIKTLKVSNMSPQNDRNIQIEKACMSFKATKSRSSQHQRKKQSTSHNTQSIVHKPDSLPAHGDTAAFRNGLL